MTTPVITTAGQPGAAMRFPMERRLGTDATLLPTPNDSRCAYPAGRAAGMKGLQIGSLTLTLKGKRSGTIIRLTCWKDIHGPVCFCRARVRYCSVRLALLVEVNPHAASAWHDLRLRACRVVTRLEEGGVFAAAAFSGLPLDFEVRYGRFAFAMACKSLQ